MTEQRIERIFYGTRKDRDRFTQDFPILPDVWMAFARAPRGRLGLLLTPHNESAVPQLASLVRARTNKDRATIQRLHHGLVRPGFPKDGRILSNESVVLAEFSFAELVRVVLPLSRWWRDTIGPLLKKTSLKQLVESVPVGDPSEAGREPQAQTGNARLFRRLAHVIGTIWYARLAEAADIDGAAPFSAEERDAFRQLMAGLPLAQPDDALLWSVNRNREAPAGVWRSRLSVKADAAATLFNINTAGLRWAVIDTGIDATHPAFDRRPATPPPTGAKARRAAKPPESRIIRTYDFLRLKDLLSKGSKDLSADVRAALRLIPAARQKELIADLQTAVTRGRAIDWNLLEPFLRVPYDARYRADIKNNPEAYRHGTHVAGIIAGNWPEAAEQTAIGRPLVGVCPDLELYDLRALGPEGDEFTVMAALQFVRHLNASKDLMVVHGVNLSMAVPHDVRNFACGRTPVCQETERVVSSGVVVVTAAGNRGFNWSPAGGTDDGALGDYRFISITDPGNAENAITVGATHRHMPHTYGVSFFSSRGPTGDGRRKPDLVAPGERIDSPTPGGQYDTMDGTSMAAPHVSGAAALLLARHRELIGQPQRVKEILCKSATDLGREPRFQGHGMLDVLRALQSV